MRLPLGILLVALGLSRTEAYQVFQKQIPNGQNVPDPCNTATTWMGVGHQNIMGGGVRNPFGLDFAANNFLWTKTLCQKDSDGDGRSNGLELGDPNCVWLAGAVPSLKTGLSHPGICEPLTSPLCMRKNSWLSCQTFSCPAFSQPGVKNISLMMPTTPVPAQETTYMCVDFSLPNDTNYEIIGNMPLINNTNIMHHILVYGCLPSDNAVFQSGPYTCLMGSKCQSLIGLWAVGVPGTCLPDQFGFLMGVNGYQHAILQFHWNNPFLVSTYTDNSGMMLFYTPTLRQYQGQILMVGQVYLDIPPGVPSIEFSGTCTSRCTQNLPRSINITNAALHMHLTGRSGSIGLYRNQQLVSQLSVVPDYNYNSPVLTSISTPVTMLPGDEIRVNCVYNSTQRNNTLYWGESTSDEMCFGFLTYYAAVPQFTGCGQWRSIDFCSLANLPLLNCDMSTFTSLMTIMASPSVCNVNCSTVCQLLIGDLYTTGCLTGDNGLLFNDPTQSPIPQAFMKLVNMCQAKMPSTTTVKPGRNSLVTGSQTRVASSFGLCGALVIAFTQLKF